MTKENKFIGFGERVEGYDVAVLNEREIRAAAGLLFLLLMIAIAQVLFRGNFIPLKYFIIVFLTDLLLRVFVNTEFSPFLIMARFISSRQTPEYVGAQQKIFAWKIGVVLVSLMFILVVIMNSYSVIVSICCLVCFFFLFFETAFGICLGCVMYNWFYSGNLGYCAGDACSSNKKQRVHKSLRKPIFMLLGFIAYVMAIMLFLHSRFSVQPKESF